MALYSTHPAHQLLGRHREPLAFTGMTQTAPISECLLPSTAPLPCPWLLTLLPIFLYSPMLCHIACPPWSQGSFHSIRCSPECNWEHLSCMQVEKKKGKNILLQSQASIRQLDFYSFFLCFMVLSYKSSSFFSMLWVVVQKTSFLLFQFMVCLADKAMNWEGLGPK